MAESPTLPKILVITGPDCVGKSTLIKMLIEKFPNNFAFPKYVNTDTNVDKDLFTVISKENFIDLMNNNGFVIYRFKDDNYVGIQASEVMRLSKEGKVKKI